jgi:hypothetical protein
VPLLAARFAAGAFANLQVRMAAAWVRVEVKRAESAREHAGGDRGDAGLDEGSGESDGAPRAHFGGMVGERCTAAARAEGPVQERRWGERCGGGAKGGAGAVDEPANGPFAEAQHGGCLLVAAAVHGGVEERLALHRGQRGEPRERLAHGDSPLEVLGGRTAASEGFTEGGVVVAGEAEHVESGVVHDAIEPGLDLAHLDAGAQRDPGLQESLLHGVLGALVGEQKPSAVAEQRASIARDERLEGAFVPAACEFHQTRIALGEQQPD